MPAKKLPTVAAYFAARLGRPLNDPQSRTAAQKRHVASPFHPDFHIETGCGIDCARAIDATALLVSHVRDAFGPDSDDEFKLVEICSDVVLCLVYG